jgi:hypothetical protein
MARAPRTSTAPPVIDGAAVGWRGTRPVWVVTNGTSQSSHKWRKCSVSR